MLDGFTAETLARAQFAFTVSFHIVFPAFSIGLASYLMAMMNKPPETPSLGLREGPIRTLALTSTPGRNTIPAA